MRYGILCLILGAAIAASGAARPAAAKAAGQAPGPATAVDVRASATAAQPMHGDVAARGHDTEDGDLDARRKLCLMACLALACQAAVAIETPTYLDPIIPTRPEAAVVRELAQTHLAPRTGPPRDLPSS